MTNQSGSLSREFSQFFCAGVPACRMSSHSSSVSHMKETTVDCTRSTHLLPVKFQYRSLSTKLTALLASSKSSGLSMNSLVRSYIISFELTEARVCEDSR